MQDMHVNPCHAEFILGNIKKILSVFDTEMVQVVATIPSGRQALIYQSNIVNTIAAGDLVMHKPIVLT